MSNAYSDQVVIRTGWHHPEVHRRRLAWLPKTYVPGPCAFCGEECDLRRPGAVIVFAFGAPVEVHCDCANDAGSWEHSPQRRDDILMSHAVAYDAWPGCRRYEVPPDGL